MRKFACAVSAMLAIPLCLLFAVPANGEGDAVSDYVDQHGGEVCGLIGDQPGLPGVKHAVDHILATSEMPEDQTGRLLSASVTVDCPEYGNLVSAFAWYMRHHQQGGGIGGVTVVGS